MSISIGVNLDSKMRPCEAAILSVNNYKYSYNNINGFMGALFGSNAPDKALTPLHTPPLKTVSTGLNQMGMTISAEDGGYSVDPMMIPLFKDLSKILKRIAKPLLIQILQYKRLAVEIFLPLIEDIPVILGVVGWMKGLQETGLKFTIPQYDLSGDKNLRVEGNFNPLLAEEFGGKIVLSDINIRPDANFFLLTGPNRGGKSVYIQSVGLTQLLAQWGFPVPGTKAVISIRDQILTHYPVQDKVADNAGRLGEESRRLISILKLTSENSLLLLNETFSTTHEAEGMYIAEDVLSEILNAGISGILVTHIHSLAEKTDEINSKNGKRVLGNLVAEIEEVSDGTIHKTFRVLEGIPHGRSYAREIAAQYGLTSDNLKSILGGKKKPLA